MDKTNSLIEQNKGALGEALARLYAERIMGVQHKPYVPTNEPAPDADLNH